MLFRSAATVILTATPASGLSGCYTQWRSGGSYSSGSYVSATHSIQTFLGTETVKKNFKCISGTQPILSHCPNYDPSNPLVASAAWEDLGACDSLSPIPAAPSTIQSPTYSIWTGKGCPDAWISGRSYEGGELVESNGIVYQCSTLEFVNEWCGESNYEPGVAQYWGRAWTLIGSCEGTISPSSSPNYVSLADAGGCPDEYVGGMKYEADDVVEMNSRVYKCNPWPESIWCGETSYEPGGPNSAIVWNLVGHCEGESWNVSHRYIRESAAIHALFTFYLT
jgi:hypothetical protein